MRVATKMALGLSATCLVIMGLHGLDQLRDEDRDLRGSVEREMRLLGSSVQVSFQNSIRDRQMEDIQQVLDSMEGIDPTVDILVYDMRGHLRAQSQGSDPVGLPEILATASAASGQAILRFDEAQTPGRLVLALPLEAIGQSASGSLVLMRPLTEMHRDLVDTRRGIIISVLLLVMATTVLQFGLGTIYVTRPLTRMAAAMQRLRSGDLSSSLSYGQKDEVGALAREFDAMVSDLREARERIAREVESRTNLERGLQQVDKLITVGQISAGLAHEIGSPLQIMNGRARALLTRPHSPPEIRKNAEILATQTDRIARIVDQLLKFSRRRPSRLVETSLVSPVQTVLDLVEHSARRRGVSIELRCAEDMPSVVSDVDQIQQIVLNLSKNALEATPAGGHIVIRIEPSSLARGHGVPPVPAARLEVEDDGCGMSAEVLDKLFEPFFTTRSAEGGTGLGLAVVKAIVSEHGGVVTATSSPGRGSRFTVDLPLHGPRWMDDALDATETRAREA